MRLLVRYLIVGLMKTMKHKEKKLWMLKLMKAMTMELMHKWVLVLTARTLAITYRIQLSQILSQARR